MSEKEKGLSGIYSEPAEDLQFETFTKGLTAHISVYCKG